MVGMLVGCEKKKTAFEKLKDEAEAGDAVVQLQLGHVYYDGKRVPRDYKEAAKWYRKSAEQGHAEAQYSLGRMYRLTDRGVPRDLVTAYVWFDIAAANGHEYTKDNKTLFAMTAEDISKATTLSKEMVAKNPKLLNK